MATELTTELIWKAFCGHRCAVCGGLKEEYTAFCPPCYSRLPRPLKNSLWKRMGEGFEESYRVCMAWFPAKSARSEERKRA
jgi:hypothetical protein